MREYNLAHIECAMAGWGEGIKTVMPTFAHDGQSVLLTQKFVKYGTNFL